MQSVGDVLIVGSGLSIAQLHDLDTCACTVVALNKAWLYAPERMDYLLHSDMLPGSYRPDAGVFADGHVVSYAAYHPVVREFAAQLDGQAEATEAMADPALFLTGHLIHFNATYWVMAQLQPLRIAYLGCDFDYAGDQSHYYGKGQAIFPVERGRAPLTQFFYWQRWFAEQSDIALVNLSDSPRSQLPYPRLTPEQWQHTRHQFVRQAADVT